MWGWSQGGLGPWRGRRPAKGEALESILCSAQQACEGVKKLHPHLVSMPLSSRV